MIEERNEDEDDLTPEQMKELGLSAGLDEDEMAAIMGDLDGLEIGAEDVLTSLVLAAVKSPDTFNYETLKETLEEFQCGAMLSDAAEIVKAERENPAEESEDSVDSLISDIDED